MIEARRAEKDFPLRDEEREVGHQVEFAKSVMETLGTLRQHLSDQPSLASKVDARRTGYKATSGHSPQLSRRSESSDSIPTSAQARGRQLPADGARRLVRVARSAGWPARWTHCSIS
jgi:hypothetical protein